MLELNELSLTDERLWNNAGQGKVSKVSLQHKELVTAFLGLKASSSIDVYHISALLDESNCSLCHSF